MYARAATAYRRVDLDSAPKAEIVARLFTRFLDDVTAARGALDAGDVGRRALAIDHALRIVIGLRAALDHGAAPALAGELDALYAFVQDQLVRANVCRVAEPLDAAVRVMRELGDAFTAIKHVAPGGHEGTP